MPSVAAMSVCDSRAPCAGGAGAGQGTVWLWDMSRMLSIAPRNHKSHYDKTTIFAETTTRVRRQNSARDHPFRWSLAMTSFDQYVPAPLGRFRRDRQAVRGRRCRPSARFVCSEHSLARRGALKLWERMKQPDPVRALGAVTGNQAMQMVRAGLEAIYLSGWQAAADANTASAMYPDQSLYPRQHRPELARPKPHAAARRSDRT